MICEGKFLDAVSLLPIKLAIKLVSMMMLGATGGHGGGDSGSNVKPLMCCCSTTPPGDHLRAAKANSHNILKTGAAVVVPMFMRQCAPAPRAGILLTVGRCLLRHFPPLLLAILRCCSPARAGLRLNVGEVAS